MVKKRVNSNLGSLSEIYTSVVVQMDHDDAACCPGRTGAAAVADAPEAPAMQI
jgi:hypothetical protein